MANRFPLVFDAQQSKSIKELPNGDNLNLAGSSIVDAVNINASGEITASSLTVNTLNVAGVGGTIAPVAISNDYNDLNNLPILFSGSYNDLTDVPIGVDWSSITSKPSIPTKLSELVNDTGFANEESLNIRADQLIGLAPVAVSNSFADLVDASEIVTQSQLVGDTLTVEVTNTGDLVGSVFGSDSTLLVDHHNNTINANISTNTLVSNDQNLLITTANKFPLENITIEVAQAGNIVIEGDEITLVGKVNANRLYGAFTGFVYSNDSTLVVNPDTGDLNGKLNGEVDGDINKTNGGTLTIESANGGISITPNGDFNMPVATNIELRATEAALLSATGTLTLQSTSGTIEFNGSQIDASLTNTNFASADLNLTGSNLNFLNATVNNLNADITGNVTGNLTGNVESTATLTLTALNGITLSPAGPVNVPNATSVTLAATEGILIQSTDDLNLISASGIINVNTSIVPDTTEAYDLGTTNNRFRDLYLSGSTIKLGTTTISAVGGTVTMGSLNIQVTGFYDQGGELTAERTAVTLKSGGYGPFTTGAVIYDSILGDPAEFPTPFDGQIRPIYSTTTVGDNVTAITGILDGGSYIFDGAGDDYLLLIGPADPLNEPYVADGTGFAYTRGFSSTFPNGTYTATFTSGNSETLSINYTVTDRIGEPGSKDVAVNSVTQSGAFIAGEIPAHPVIPGYAGTVQLSGPSLWQVNQLDPTALYFGAIGIDSDIDFNLGSNMGDVLRDSSDNNVFINLATFSTPANQSAKNLSVSNVINIGTSTVPPTSPQDGDIALADGTLWDPVATGKKTLVIYLSSTWVQIAVAP